MNYTLDDAMCGCEAAELYLGQAFIQIWQRTLDGAANTIASRITDRSALALGAITMSLFLALCQFSAIRRSYRNPTKLWHNDLLAILGYIAATVYIPLYALHVRSPLSTTLNSADFGYMCIVLMAFVLFHEACGSRVIDYKGRMYRVEMVDVERMARMADREDRDEVGFDEFWGVGQKETP